MSTRAAKLIAVALYTFGVVSLVMLATNLDALGLFLLILGLATLSVATWISTATGTVSNNPSEEAPHLH